MKLRDMKKYYLVYFKVPENNNEEEDREYMANISSIGQKNEVDDSYANILQRSREF